MLSGVSQSVATFVPLIELDNNMKATVIFTDMLRS